MSSRRPWATGVRSAGLALAGVSMLGLIGCQLQPATLEIATPQFPVDREIAEDLITLLAPSSKIDLEQTAQPLPEGDALDALQQGEIDLALVSNAVAYRPGIESVIPLYPTVLHIAYREGRAAGTGRELLTDARVFAGSEDSASRLIFDRVVEQLDLEDTGFRFVEAESQADVIVRFAPLSPHLVAEKSGLKLFSFGSPEDIGSGTLVDAAIMMNPHLRRFVIPAGTYGTATPEPVLTVAVDNYLVARSGLSDSVVYDLVREILLARPALVARNPGLFSHLREDFDVSGSTFVVHSGSRLYLERDEPKLYERYAGVVQLGITLTITTFSMLLAGIRILQRRRKNRIDEYYLAALDIQASMRPASGAADRRDALERLQRLQHEAFAMLVAEKLNADESFRIFYSLSREVKREIERIDAAVKGGPSTPETR